MKAVVPVGRGTIARALVAVVTVLVSTACATSGDAESEASCAFRVEYDGRMYSDVTHVEFEAGRRLGPAVLPGCDDAPGDGHASPDSTVAYAIEGVDPRVAIAVDDAPEDVLFVVQSLKGDLPSEVKKLVKGS
ncbi:DUF6281 family protein [Streptomyces fumanus]|uniref:DUF6281 family protein n=1 Tax=Streptomyces fumanus TaxID=67302 RepID=UPI0033DA1650